MATCYAVANMLLSRIIDQNFDMPKSGDCFCHHLYAKFLIAHISGNQYAFPATLFNFLFCVICIPMLVQVNNDDSAPSLAKATNTARPIPLSPPVIIATLDLSLPLPLYPSTASRAGASSHFPLLAAAVDAAQEFSSLLS